jgi:hypothetical protein
MATFKEAFAAARKAGKETFVYDGKLYTTDVAVKEADETKFVTVTNTVKDSSVPSVSKLKKNVWPLQSELRKKFGVPDYGGTFKKNMVQVNLPYTMWMDDIKITKTWMNKLCADSLIRVLTHVWDANERDYDKIKAQQLHIFSGSWNIRNMRGGHSLSTHAFGLAIDIAAPYNMLGKKPGYNKFSFTENSVIVKAFEAEGWVWGGRWDKRPDGMHFQAARVG